MVARWLVLLGILVMACEKKTSPDPGSNREASQPLASSADARNVELATTLIDRDAVAMAGALRQFYPWLRVADDLNGEWMKMEVGPHALDRRSLIALRDGGLRKVRAKLPSDEHLSGCALDVARAVETAIDEAIADRAALPSKAKPMPFDEINAGWATCAASLFRVGSADAPTDRARPAEVEGHLGLEDDGDPFNFQKEPNTPRMGHLWAATGHEINRSTGGLL